jgi:hypothetical protein
MKEMQLRQGNKTRKMLFHVIIVPEVQKDKESFVSPHGNTSPTTFLASQPVVL